MTTAAVLSVNIATTVHKGRSGIDKRPFPGPRMLAGDRVEGDSVVNRKYHGGRWQAVYSYAREDAEWWEGQLDTPIPAGRFGENLTTEGLDVGRALIGEVWRVGGATLQVTVPRIPCRVFAGFWGRPDLIRMFTAARRPGAYLRIVEEGPVCAGDAIEILDRPAHAVSIAEAFACKTGDREHLDLLRATADLPPDWRKWLDTVRDSHV